MKVYKILRKQLQVADGWVADEKHILNVYKSPAKEHHVVDSWAANETSVSGILFCKSSEYVDSLMLPN